MNAAEVSPSQSIESSLLGHHNAPPSPSAFVRPTARAQNPGHQSPIVSHETSSASSSDSDEMDHQPTPPPDQLEEPPPPSPPPAAMDSEIAPIVDGQDHDRMVIDPNESTASTNPATQAETEHQSLPAPPSQPLPPTLGENSAADPNPPPIPSPDVLLTIPPHSHAPPPVSAPANTVNGNVDVSARERSATESSTDHTQEAEEDSEDDDYDGHIEFLNRFRPDETQPSEDELRDIESSVEKSAVNHDEWKRLVFTPLDDPEHIAGESGIIRWTLEGFHGTKESPNKKRIMRSPPVVIGGYKWNVKVFPHGNEGTDQISVYIECSGKDSPLEANRSQSALGSNAPESEERPSSAKATDTEPTQPDRESSKPWDVAAQIGCLMFNPQEPRVWVFEKATHHFENSSQDWGWVRFHGPWSDIHRRRPLQRKPILQNDTLSFVGFVRVVEDPTKALWWRSTGQSTWDSVAKTGYRGLSAEEPANYSYVAALAPWLHLKQFRDLILSTKIPDPIREPSVRMRPLFEQMQELLYAKNSPKESSQAVSLFHLQHNVAWYEHSFSSSSDIIELWESFRSILNEEYYNNDLDQQGADVLGFMKTFRQNMRPVLPAKHESSAPTKEPHSVQQVLDDASQEGTMNYKMWEGYEQAEFGFPSVLQIELHRQKYDTQSRKWRKLTHKIKLDETVQWNGRHYTLFSLTVHKGELGSGRFYSVVRPGGPSSPWVRYKSGVTTYLTHRQAVESHEGKGDVREGTESVAYLTIYVLSDQFNTLAPVPQERCDSGVLGPLTREDDKGQQDVSSWESIPLVIHSSSLFPGRSGTGFLDLWSSGNIDRHELSMRPSATLSDVQQILVSEFNATAKPEQCRLWPMRITPNSLTPLSRYSPAFTSLAPKTKLHEIPGKIGVDKDGGIHLWLHVIPSDLVLDQPIAPSTSSIQSSDGLPQIHESDTNMATEPTALTRQASSNQDVVMGGTQEQPTIDEPTSPQFAPAATAPEEDNSQTTPEIQWQLQDQLYIFLKKFDPEQQQLTGLGGFFVCPTEQIRAALSPLVPSLASFRVFHEVDTDFVDSELPSDATFTSVGFTNGSILVVEPDNLSEALTEKIRKRGDAVSAVEYFQILGFLSHFAYTGSEHVSSYFGGPYVYAPLRNGRFFGQCTMIDDTTGDAYVGNCIGGLKSGQGVMYFANGDTYTGDWTENLPEGTGTMVYHGTGNTYIGGWKAGRRHGKGVMNYEVADEEMQLCKICYESEMDALFYRCGHVAACEMCARQVRDCPVCRRPVDAVVKIWRT